MTLMTPMTESAPGVRYVVVGAGAIGGTVGGLLAQAGSSVVLVARGAHGEAIAACGLTLSLPGRTLRVGMPVVPSIDRLELRAGDVILLAVRSQDSAHALGEVAALPVGGSTAADAVPLFCLQNGVENEQVALRFFARVHGVNVALPATLLAPGSVEANGAPFTGILEVGGFPRGHDDVDTRFVVDLNASGFTAAVRDDVMAWKRPKLLQNLAHAVEAICGTDLDDIQRDIVTRIATAARSEGLACFAAAGLSLVDDGERDAWVAGKMRVEPIDGRPRQGSSTWQSIARGAASVETDYFNGEIVRLGRLNGVATPINRELQRRMAAIASRRLQPGATAPSEIVSAAETSH